MQTSPQDTALIVNALNEKAAGDRKAAQSVPLTDVAIHLVTQAQRAEELAEALECGDVGVMRTRWGN